MTRCKSIIILISLFLAPMGGVWAQKRADKTKVSRTDSVLINFRQSKWNLDMNIGNNAAVLDGIDRRLSDVLNDSVYRLRHVSVFGGASPEGSVEFNKYLSEQRAQTLFGWFDKYKQLSDLDKTFTFFGRDWNGVFREAEKDPALPYREETLALLRTIVKEKRAAGGTEPKGSLDRLKRLRGGVPYKYLYKNIFPTVRASKVVIDYERILAPEVAMRQTDTIVAAIDTVYVDRIVQVTDTLYYNSCPPGPFYMDIRSNMLYDVLTVPNLGAEFYLGKNWSIGGTWKHAWWSNDRKHRYWRFYGGELFARYWFGKEAEAKPLTGHHLGVYLQATTYDFEFGGTAHMGGEPGGNIYDRAHLGGGVEYGYSLPIAKRFNIDFSLGIGYLGGRVYEFIPVGDRYLWTATKQKHWFGPTKIEIAIAWLIGRGNFNKKKEKGGDK